MTEVVHNPHRSPSDHAKERAEHQEGWRMYRLRRGVRQTASLISPGREVKEQIGGGWACDYEKRTIFWTPYSGNGRLLTDDEVTFLIAHESGHLLWTGHYPEAQTLHPLIEKIEQEKFHLLVNAVEDIRIERLLSKDFGGFDSLRRTVTATFLADRANELRTSRQGRGFYHFAVLWFIAHEINATKGLSDAYRSLAKNVGEKSKVEQNIDLLVSLWPQVDQAARENSTADLAKAIVPVYLAIRDQDGISFKEDRIINNAALENERFDASGREEDSEGSGEGGQGETSSDDSDGSQEAPSGASGASGDEESDETAEGGGAGAGEDGDAGEDTADGSGGEGDSPDDAPKVGPDAGTGKGTHEGDDNAPSAPYRSEPEEGQADNRPGSVEGQDATKGPDRYIEPDYVIPGAVGDSDSGGRTRISTMTWAEKARLHRGAINVLTHRLKSTLRHNAQEDYVGGQRRGRFDSRRAHRLERGDYSVFRKRREIGTHDYTIGVLLDVSGSMGLDEKKFLDSGRYDRYSDRDWTIYDTAVVVTEAIERSGMGQFILTWSGEPELLKTENIPLKKAVGALGHSLRNPDGGTDEARALFIAEREFRRSNAKGKLLLVVTDGQTSSPESAELMVDDMERKLGVTPVFVGLHVPVPARYRIGLTVKSHEELGRELPNLLARSIRRGV